MILATALFMENMDSTVIATSLAAIAADIGTEPISLKLALTAYLVALAIFIPISSWMADRFGARRVFRVAMLVFMIGSLCCAFSGSLEQFVGARFIQGMGGAMMGPVARLVLVRMTPRHQLVDAMAWLTIPALIGPIVGPPFGGFLTTFFSWHWIFIINIPIGMLGIVLVGLALPNDERSAPRKIDGPGFVLAGLAFALFAFGCSVVSLPALPPIYGVVSAALGIGLGYIYVRHALSTEYPLLDLRLLAVRNFRITMVAGTFFRLGQGAVPFLFPLMLQLAFGLTPFQSGMVTFAGAVGALAAKFVANWIFAHWGFKYPLVASTAISAAGILVMGFYEPGTPIPLMLAILVFTGFWQSTFWTGSNAFTFADVEDKDAGQANTMSQVWGQLMFAMGVALGGGTLELAHRLRGGDELALSDFHMAFYVVAAVGALATILYLRLPRNAGHQLSARDGVH
ncbi:MFS transporter [Devosia rhizoryzae]|uniref:MFS transporter n=1 Tax=Devosia rhizoryzae TaxID=2774137 RepID=A0ABX7CGW1_9HYPH|nr:MFS transporter [Devosia rhizoryzae]